MAEIARAIDPDEVELVLDGILATAGAGRYLVCGPGAAPLAASLVRRGLEATHRPALAQAMGSFDVAILWHVLDSLEPAACGAALRDLRPGIARAVVIRTDGTKRPRSPLGECWAEGPALAAGYRKHPLY